MLTCSETRGVHRSWEPCDFFELANVEPPVEAIAPGCHCLLYGPAGCGKTTLLFQHALAVTRRDPDARVLFICRREAIEASPPLLPRASADVEPATRIQMKYLANHHEVGKLASLMHLLPPEELPSLIILDDFSGFFPGGRGSAGGRGDGGGGGGQGQYQGTYGGGNGAAQHSHVPHDRREREMSLMRTIAALHECALFIRRPPGGDEKCLLLISERAEENSDLPPAAYLFQKWFACMMAVRPAREGDEGWGCVGAGVETARHAAKGNTFEIWPWRSAGISSGRIGGIRYAVDNSAGTLVPIGFT